MAQVTRIALWRCSLNVFFMSLSLSFFWSGHISSSPWSNVSKVTSLKDRSLKVLSKCIFLSLSLSWYSARIVIFSRDCDIQPGMWYSAGIVIIQPVLWYSAWIVIFCRDCESQQGLWKSVRIVKFSRDCEIQPGLWNSARIAKIQPGLWNSAGIVKF